MRTSAKIRGRGAGRALLNPIIETARQRGYRLLSLETGPFAGYLDDPHSLFMAPRLSEGAA